MGAETKEVRDEDGLRTAMMRGFQGVKKKKESLRKTRKRKARHVSGAIAYAERYAQKAVKRKESLKRRRASART
eukprot:NODE_12370_length_281_cov_14.577586_g11457_i0.p3 GENE.NODE_12370_length_281_cov_14.577586_g11457_i0~~NODE_12370_length_281_cov_14.577586_g11457_i0.p3  ORF type:complete len:86 (+),score=29.85 NODE_12370_length_281_cov_14.577586_g11457_i0:39-260(+)